MFQGSMVIVNRKNKQQIRFLILDIENIKEYNCVYSVLIVKNNGKLKLIFKYIQIS